MPDDIAVRYEAVAVALDVSIFTLRRNLAAGKLPPADLLLPAVPAYIRAWRLATLRAWNPEIAHRCAAMLCALEAEKKSADGKGGGQ